MRRIGSARTINGTILGQITRAKPPNKLKRKQHPYVPHATFNNSPKPEPVAPTSLIITGARQEFPPLILILDRCHPGRELGNTWNFHSHPLRKAPLGEFEGSFMRARVLHGINEYIPGILARQSGEMARNFK